MTFLAPILQFPSAPSSGAVRPTCRWVVDESGRLVAHWETDPDGGGSRHGGPPRHPHAA
jgi:hypothetical protein